MIVTSLLRSRKRRHGSDKEEKDDGHQTRTGRNYLRVSLIVKITDYELIFELFKSKGGTLPRMYSIARRSNTKRTTPHPNDLCRILFQFMS